MCIHAGETFCSEVDVFLRILLFYILSILLIGMNGEQCLYSNIIFLTCSSFSPQYPGTTRISLTRAQRHLPSPSFFSNLALVNYILFLLRKSYSFRSHFCILHERRRSQLRDFRGQSCAFCWHTCALRACPSLPCAVPVRVDDARRRPASRAASDEQLQRAVFRQLVHRQRSAMGMATKSRWRV